MTDINKEYEKEYYDEYRNNYYNPDDDDGEPGINLNWKRIQKGFHSVAAGDQETTETLSGMQATLGTLSEDVGTLKTDVEEIKESIDDLNTAVETAEQAAEAAAASEAAAQAAQAAIEEIAESIPEDYSELSADVDDLKNAFALFQENIPGTVQTIAFDSAGNIQSVTHKENNVVVRTDVFTFAASTITEVRTLASGESLTIVTNTETLETTTTYAAA